MPTPAPLTDQERRRIEAEELAKAQAAAELEAERERLLAAQQYRQEVRQALRPRPRWMRWLWLLPFVPLAVGAVYFGLRPQPVAVADDSWGGILNSELMSQCRAAVSDQTYGQEPDLRFPTPQEAAGQFSANADGKSWNGWAARPDGTHLDFVCSYSPATQEVTAEIMR